MSGLESTVIHKMCNVWTTTGSTVVFHQFTCWFSALLSNGFSYEFFANLLEIGTTAGRCDIYAMVCGGTVSMIIFCDAGVG